MTKDLIRRLFIGYFKGAPVGVKGKISLKLTNLKVESHAAFTSYTFQDPKMANSNRK